MGLPLSHQVAPHPSLPTTLHAEGSSRDLTEQMKALCILISLWALAHNCLAIQYGKFSKEAAGQDQKLVTTTTSTKTMRGTSNVLMGGYCHITAAHNVWKAYPRKIFVHDSYKDRTGQWRVNSTRRRAPDRVLIHPRYDGAIDSPYDVALLGFDDPWESAGTSLNFTALKPLDYLRFRGWGLNEKQAIPTYLSQGSAFVSSHNDTQCSWESLLGVCIRAPYSGKRGLACSGDSGACLYSGRRQCKGLIITSHPSPNAKCGNYTSNGVVEFGRADVSDWFADVLLDCILDGAAVDDYPYDQSYS